MTSTIPIAPSASRRGSSGVLRLPVTTRIFWFSTSYLFISSRPSDKASFCVAVRSLSRWYWRKAFSVAGPRHAKRTPPTERMSVKRSKKRSKKPRTPLALVKMSQSYSPMASRTSLRTVSSGSNLISSSGSSDTAAPASTRAVFQSAPRPSGRVRTTRRSRRGSLLIFSGAGSGGGCRRPRRRPRQGR